MATISNIFINQGADFSTTVTISDSDGTALNLAAFTALAQIRKTYESATISELQQWKLQTDQLQCAALPDQQF